MEGILTIYMGQIPTELCQYILLLQCISSVYLRLFLIDPGETNIKTSPELG